MRFPDYGSGLPIRVRYHFNTPRTKLVMTTAKERNDMSRENLEKCRAIFILLPVTLDMRSMMAGAPAASTFSVIMKALEFLLSTAAANNFRASFRVKRLPGGMVKNDLVIDCVLLHERVGTEKPIENGKRSRAILRLLAEL
ncbi:unnamed protein product [Calypogeia fissa]